MSCIFCDIVERKREGYFIYEDENHVAFLDKYPIDKGHALVVTKKHYERITDMDEKSVGMLFSQIPKITRAIMNTTNADAFSLAQNNGRAAKQIIPHVHVHIIPRYNDTGSMWTKRTIPTSDDLKSLAEQIRAKLAA
ncbi:MAG: HIT family protein [Candidatus Nitrosotenuis sp.]|uniref:Histidine triad (HIT) protein n=1 Tax=Candidatus Nitrosotenuis uzonensis TaxID=1407055 RepID=A0A812F3N4_9ARCH|nr:HIT family protein [Candidatus Nitrosotenuis uzonensis]MCA2003378.1 HIT family protein [Candidatus Nitrosotenuis sp.]CAE6498983.1 Histidine triad (HIT) protein [Candidatus Nitrosotenuis uzonensis]